MPYVTLAEQGIRNPTDQIQEAVQNAIRDRMMTQQTSQQAQAFPIEQQQRQATADESSATADTIRQRLTLQMQAQDLQNQLSKTQLDYEKETNPDRKALLKSQVDHLNAQVGNIAIQGRLLEAQAGEASARGNLYNAEADKSQPGLNPYNISETSGKPDAYGNVPVTKKWTDASGKVVHSEDNIMPGRGQPRVAYKQVPDPETGQLKRVPGVLQEDPATGEMTVHFPDEAAAPTGEPQRNAVTDGIVQQYFDAGSGQPKTGWIGKDPILPKTAKDRAQLRQILANPGLVQEYGLNAYGDLAKALGPGGAAVAPVADTSADPAGEGSLTARPSSVTSGSGNQDDMTRTGDGGPSGVLPSLVAPQDTPAGVNPGGAPVKAGNVAAPGAPAVGAVPIMSGRAQAKPPVAVAPIVSGAKPGSKSSAKFQDQQVGAYFYQGGIRYKKTSATSALPAEAADATAAPVAPGQSPSLPAAQGM